MNTKITKKTQHKVTAMLELDRLQDSALINMSMILLEFRNKNLAFAIRGINSGYQIVKSIESISEIMNAVGERITVTRYNRSDSYTSSKERCMSHRMCHELKVVIESYLSPITLKDISLFDNNLVH